jgi:acetolactate synthase-1/2/3 large subunit
VTERAVREADVLLALGCRFSEFTTKRWTLLSPTTRLIHVDIDPTELGRVYVPEVAFVSDARLAAEALSARLKAGGEAPQQRLRDLRAEFDRVSSLDADELAADDPGTGVSSRSAVAVLQHLAEREDVLLLQDAPSFAPWTHRYLRLPRPRTLYASAGGAMAWGLPAAMGVALARPDQRVVTVSGDGSFWMVAQDFETCVREDIPLVNIVMNNFSYGNTRDRQRSTHGGRYLGVFYGNPDFAEFARSLGGFGARVEKDDDLAVAVHEALAQDRPAIIDVVQDQMYGLPPGLTPPAAR